MKILKSALAVVMAAVLLLPLFSCDTAEVRTKDIVGFYNYETEKFEKYFHTTGTFYSYAKTSDEKFNALADKVEKEIKGYHKLYNIHQEYTGINNLATVNKMAGKGPVKVDRKIIDLLLYSKEMYTLTDGKVNVAMGSVLSIWHKYRADGRGTSLPPMEMLEAAAKHTDISSVVIDEKNLTVEITDPEASLDVGAVAKGYAVEAIAKMLESEGKGGYILDIGGNLRTIGKKPSGDDWIAGVRNPNDPYLSNYVYIMTLKGEALVTSGVYERCYTVDGVRYHHIINGETLMPENYYLSVSIKSPSSALSDALSTAVFNMKPAEAKSFVESMDKLFVVLVMPSGEVVTLGKDF